MLTQLLFMHAHVHMLSACRLSWSSRTPWCCPWFRPSTSKARCLLYSSQHASTPALQDLLLFPAVLSCGTSATVVLSTICEALLCWPCLSGCVCMSGRSTYSHASCLIACVLLYACTGPCTVHRLERPGVVCCTQQQTSFSCSTTASEISSHAFSHTRCVLTLSGASRNYSGAESIFSA